MANEAVHFRGIDSTVDAYEKNGVIPWAIISQKEIMFSCPAEMYTDEEAASDNLRSILDMLKAQGSTCKYSLQVYKLKGEEDILSNTPFYRSFRFSLESYTDLSPYHLGRNTFASDMGNRMSKLEDMCERILAQKEEAPEYPEDKPFMAKLGGMFNGLLDNPMIQEVIAMKVAGFFGMRPPAPGKVAGQDPEGYGLLSADQVTKVQQAVQQLSQVDDKLGDHLLGVAKIARENPLKYRGLTAML